MLQNFFLTPVPAYKMNFDVQGTTHNAPYKHPRLDLILELCQTFPIDSVAPQFVSVSTQRGAVDSSKAMYVRMRYVCFTFALFIGFQPFVY